MAERKADRDAEAPASQDKTAAVARNRAGVPKSQEKEPVVPKDSPVSEPVERAGVTPTAPGEVVVPEGVPGADTGAPAENAPDPLRGIIADTEGDREAAADAPDAHADPPPGEGLTPEDEVREEHIRRKMSAGGAGTVPELLEARVEAARAAVKDAEANGASRLARQMQVSPEALRDIRLSAVDLAAPPILGHKLASHDEHRLASDDDRSDVEKVRAAVLEARYPVSVGREGFEEALASEGFSDDNRMEARQMARRNEIYVRGR